MTRMQCSSSDICLHPSRVTFSSVSHRPSTMHVVDLPPASLITVAHGARRFPGSYPRSCVCCVFLAPSPVHEAMAPSCYWLCCCQFGLLLEASDWPPPLARCSLCFIYRGSSSSKKFHWTLFIHRTMKSKAKSERERSHESKAKSEREIA
jgi:hypothetical protein